MLLDDFPWPLLRQARRLDLISVPAAALLRAAIESAPANKATTSCGLLSSDTMFGGRKEANYTRTHGRGVRVEYSIGIDIISELHVSEPETDTVGLVFTQLVTSNVIFSTHPRMCHRLGMTGKYPDWDEPDTRGRRFNCQ